MIKLDFYNDGFEVNGHDIEKICWVVSYATWSTCLHCDDNDPNVVYFQSGTNKGTENLGLTYLKCFTEEAKHFVCCLKEEMEQWNEEVGFQRLQINVFDSDYKIKHNYHV